MTLRTPASFRRLVPALVVSAVAPALAQDKSLLEARRGFQTKLVKSLSDAEPLADPPPQLFKLVRFKGPAGQLQAYLSNPRGQGPHPALVWLTGGFPPGAAGPVWEEQDPENDQSAQVYWQSGLIVMYPALRGTAGNPGRQEGFFGEVDDVLAAVEMLAQAPGVDPQRIYLGGHSTGGTLALLVAAASDRFRAVISFGPVEDPAVYGADELPYDPQNAQEARLRAPINFLGAIRSPTFVIEGEGSPGNLSSLRALEKANKNPLVRFLPVKGGNHFDVLGPSNALIARRLAALTGDAKLELDAAALTAALSASRKSQQEANDLELLARARRAGVELGPHKLAFYLFSRDKTALSEASQAAGGMSFTAEPLTSESDGKGRYFVLRLTRKLDLSDLKALFAASAQLAHLARLEELSYGGWEPID